MKANEKARQDPAVKQQVREVLVQRNAVMTELKQRLMDLAPVTREYPYRFLNDTAARVDTQILNQLSQLIGKILEWQPHPVDNDTYLGNLAAFEFTRVFATLTTEMADEDISVPDDEMPAW